MRQKVTWSILLSAVVFLLVACGTEETSGQGEAQWNSGDYQREFLPVEQGDVFFTDIILADGWAGYQYSETNADGTNVSGIRLCSLIDKTVRDCSLSVQFGEYLEKYTPDGNGGIYAVLGRQSGAGADGEGSGREYYLVAFDSDGKERFRRNITGQVEEDEAVSVSEISVDSQGRLYVSGRSHIWLYSAEGEYHGTVNLDGQKYSFFRFAGIDRKGGMYVVGYGRTGYELAEIDFDRKKVGSVYSNFNTGSNICVFGRGIEKDFLMSDGTFAYEYDLENKSLVKLFQWMDFDINGDDIQSLSAVSGGSVAATGRERDDTFGQSFLVWITNRSETVSDKSQSGTTPGGVSDAPTEKQEIVLATLSSKNDRYLKTAVVNFNSASETYHITIKEYGNPSENQGERYERWTMDEWSDAVTRLNADLISDNCPDILDLTDLNIEELAQKGVFLDLGPFLDGSSVLSREDYPANILEACTYQGNLLGIPKLYSVTSVMAHVSDVGTEQGWSLEELMAYAAANPGAELFENATKSEIMNYCMSFYESSFVDWASGECHFDSPEFKELLGFVKGFPDEKEKADGELASLPTKIGRRDVLLDKKTLTYYSEFQVQNAVFEDDGIWIGFPTPDKSPGHALHLSSVYAVTARSRAAEGAWEFIEGYLAEEMGPNNVVGGFPSNQQELQKYFESSFEYQTNSRGEPVLDEEGQPRYVRGTGGTLTWSDGWSCDLHHETLEEIEQIRELLNAARRSDTFNGNGIIMMIIGEEAEAFYKDQKSVDETAKIIQNRVDVYIKENKS